ncbi:hypothetical protein ACWDSJ_28380 [Nocardia sp. NPDC003482]
MRLSVAHRHRVVALALDLTAWLQTLALHNHPGRRWEPKQHAYSYSRFPCRQLLKTDPLANSEP